MGFLENYQASHTHPVNKALHIVGIPAIVLSIGLFVWDAMYWNFRYWILEAALFVLGWILQFIGHAFEKKPPLFFSNPMYLWVGPLWWVMKIFGLKKTTQKNCRHERT